MTRTFTKDELIDNVFDGDWKTISDKIVDNGRWSIHHVLIFQTPDQPANEAWEVSYSVGATEQQCESPWEHEDKVEATLVHQVEKVVKVWKPVK